MFAFFLLLAVACSFYVTEVKFVGTTIEEEENIDVRKNYLRRLPLVKAWMDAARESEKKIITSAFKYLSEKWIELFSFMKSFENDSKQRTKEFT